MRLGPDTPPRRFFRRPRGFIDLPAPGSELPRGPVHLTGWCLFPGSTVADVEVRVNGGAPQRARLAVERSDIAALTTHPDAPIAAFEHKCDLTGLPSDLTTVRLEATAHSIDGGELRLPPVECALGAAAAPFTDVDGRAAELRDRSMRPLQHGARIKATGPTRLLAFTHMLVHGGGSLYLLELLRRLKERSGFDCEVVTLADGPLGREFEEIGIPVHVTDGYPVTSLDRYEGSMAELVAWSAPGGYDVVLANTLASFSGIDLASRLGIPAVWAIHESFTPTMFLHAAYAPGTLHPYARLQAEQALRTAAALVFEAEPTRRLFLADAEPERLLTMPYGIELEAIDAARRTLDRATLRRRLGVDETDRVILCMGSIEPRKSQAMLTAAFAQVAERHPDAKLVLVGETDKEYCAGYRSALREYIDRAGLRGRVRIEAETDDPYAWHALADLLVCASDIESLPRVILEAMAFGTPVLSTRVFGAADLIDDGSTGYLCDMRSVADLAGALDRVLKAGPAELAAVADAASAHVRARHDPDRYSDSVADLLTGLVRDRHALPADLMAGATPAPVAVRSR
jgi:D-inositol-3-phosphate glycosyltransferase